MKSAATARVLTVEDDPIVRADLRLILEDAGYEVCPDAHDGVEAVDLAREHRPDLILMDLGLPRLSGVDATRQIVDELDVPVIALTGSSTREFVQGALSAGAVGHVSKPFSQANLVATLVDVLAERTERDHAEDRDLRSMVESMLAAGRSEREITLAVARARGGRAS